MNDNLLDISMTELVRAADINLRSRAFLDAQIYPNFEFLDGPELTVLTWPSGGVVLHASFSEEQTSEKIQQFLQHYKLKGLLPMEWIVTPASKPTDLGKQLEAQGFTLEGPYPVMAVPLRDLDYHQALPDGFTVERIHDFAGLDQWAKAFLAVEYISESDAAFFSKIFERYGFGPEAPYQLCMGLLHNQPVATSYAYFAGGVAGIYKVFTIPEVRRRGFGTAMTLAAAQAGLEAGYHVGLLFATEMGYPVYCLMGFHEYFHNDVYGSPKM
jgi:GNAT superfamily N-acetyltransferase